MRSVLRIGTLLILFLVTLSACTAPSSMAFAPTATLVPRQQAVQTNPRNQVKLASGQYQLLMFYSPQ